MIKNNLIKHIVSLSSLTFLLIGCGGGSGGKETSLSKIVNLDAPSQFDTEPYYKYAWHFSSKSNSFSNNFNINPNSHINIENAWKITKGKYQVGGNLSQPVKIAVIDSNFNTSHEDYKDSIIAQCNLDNFPISSYPDLSSIPSNDIINYCNVNTNVSPSAGEYSHGTAVTSFITSKANSKGLVGAAPEAEIVLIKLPNDIARMNLAFEYARLMDVKVINNSWGTINGPDSSIISKLNELKNTYGINIVFASGNGDTNGIALNLDTDKDDEAELDSVIGVGATNKDNNITAYSNYGSTIDVIAPGGESIGVLGAFVTNNEVDHGPNSNGENIDTTNYSFTQGTSFSAPITTGVIALMISVNPNLTPDQIRTILIETADKINSETESYVDLVGDGTTSTFNTQRAYGKINAYAAVKKAQDMF